ncbi:hypothetical protein ILUMI_02843 [Ignelater luminosus]|uniref:Cytochrome P450 n=1 Tax=Ignelater luminosus TaxID=2038154 RepID=A0A8K0DGX9_IGNLU|nr:hypothetical protein ILUMI_02843 [Ignelater luminosus]
MWLIIFIIALAILFYYTGIKPTKYWKDRGIPCIEPWPYVGNFAEIVFKTRAAQHVVDDVYCAFPERRYCGVYNFNIPALMLRDPELIKKIMVKEFDTFAQHRSFIPEDVDPLWNKNMFAMKGGEKWQDMRSTLSPTFTSSKMKMMFELMKDCSKQFSNYHLKQNNMVTIEIKDAFTRFATDVIATTAFGITCNSLEHKDNEFYLMGKKISDFTGLRGLSFLIAAISPTLAKILRIPVFSPEAKLFFGNLVKETIQIREEKGIVRPDMIHLLMEAKKGSLESKEQSNKAADTGFPTVHKSETGKVPKRQKTKISDEDITAQCLGFFFAGFESVSNMMCFACYELALHPYVQEILREEVDQTLTKCHGDFTYEALMGMKYLDMVVTESLRKWPPFPINDRESIRPFTIEAERPGEKPLYLPKGSVCIIPAYSIQRDPKYFPDPDKFDPERFNDENKGGINPFTFHSFGAGPRNCIGSRFALMEGKLIVAEIISKFEIVPVEKTQIPIEINTNSVTPIPTEGIWLGFKPRMRDI